MKRITSERQDLNRALAAPTELTSGELAALGGAHQKQQATLVRAGGPVTMFSGYTPTFAGSYVNYGYPYGSRSSGWGTF